MTIKGGLRESKSAVWGGVSVQFDDDIVKFEGQVAWPHDDIIETRQATCSNSPTKRCKR